MFKECPIKGDCELLLKYSFDNPSSLEPIKIAEVFLTNLFLVIFSSFSSLLKMSLILIIVATAGLWKLIGGNLTTSLISLFGFIGILNVV